ncbi:SpaA isopeptide-forming pilin-related protein [Paenibacillus luteus]|uniref:SpaA isopeptide-forming pilin-related protein n=1 Tax=Paenibacillus luteus TaxID=2545753 RepID=UPI001141649D|nr:SpaA isopeptide-forming pilin-related protein [Paenibacillus luteus]
MRDLKKRISLSLAFLLLFSLALGSLATAEALNTGGSAVTEPPIENSCSEYSTNRDFVIANHSNIVVNGDGTATATFQTTQDCVRVSFSSYEAAPDWIAGPNDLTIPYNKQTHFDGQSIIYPKAGTHTVTINIPKCLPYQLDIYSGLLLINLGTGAHGDKIKAWKLKLQNTCSGSIVINKHLNNAEGAPHAGITFELWKDGKLVQSGVTGSNGVLQFNNLPIGTYTLKELTLDGFTTDLSVEERIPVTVDSSALKIVINTPKLNLIAACSADPNKSRTWIVSNESNIDVPYTWGIPDTTQTGTGSIPAKTSVTITTNAVPGSNTLKVYWSNEKELTLVSAGETCPTPTPSTTPSPTPETTPTVPPSASPSPSPETTPTVPPSASPSPSPETTPTVPPSASPSPSPETTPTVPPSASPSPSPETTPTVPPSATPTPESTPTSTPNNTPGTTPPSSPPVTSSPTPTTTTTTTPVASPTAPPSDPPSAEPTTIVEIDDEDTPIGGVNAGTDDDIDTVIDSEDDQVPLATLPKTGDTSPIPYYLLGAFAISAGFLTLRKQRKQR